MDKSKRNTTVYIPPALKARVYTYMIRTGRTQGATGRGLSELVAEALAAFLSAQKTKTKKDGRMGKDREG